ncbi:hypothetical protein AAFF_G00125790 [Aldrovandia affinis]|uniref:Fish-egg lectin-like n=1 Tax=Aldrovandia affinis TaxID=143900 RepID=A0AAD7RR09_9TELE|nr:hypothetical protein AAFF_G00125790 [Aldrovandia affinis]
MGVREVILLVQCLLGSSLAMQCQTVDGILKQIDAGAGQVSGVNDNDEIYILYGRSWTKLPGLLKHVTVGPSGVWGTNKNNEIYKLVAANWVKTPGLLKQVDAGGDQFVAGVNMNDNVFCLGRDDTVGYKGSSSPLSWQVLPGNLMYYSCGPYSCWGVNKAQDIFVMTGVTPTACMGSTRWEQVLGKLVMVEVGTDGSVYGVNAEGTVFHRDGITACQPAGTVWTDLSVCGKSKHVTYDLGHLWVIDLDGKIQDCQV